MTHAAKTISLLAGMLFVQNAQATARPNELDSVAIPLHIREFPVSREELYQRVDRFTLAQCKGASTDEIENNCIAAAQARITVCRSNAYIPESIKNISSFKTFVAPYLRCSQPMQICRGVEIGNEDEALKYCNQILTPD